MSTKAAIKFMKPLGMPLPSSKLGHTLARGLRAGNRKSYNSVGGWIALVIFSPLIIGLLLMVFVIALLVVPISLLFPAGRRKVLGGIRGHRRPLIVEISADPIVPGEEVQGMVQFKKGGPIASLAIQLNCQERASYTQGTDTVTASEDVYELTLFEEEQMERVQPGYIQEFTFTVPAEAMHSFQASNNEIRWELIVKRVFPPDHAHELRYIFDVYPLELAERVVSDFSEALA